MIQHTYLDQFTSTQNITYGVLSSGILANNRSLRDLSNHTVIIVADDVTDDSLIRNTAETILRRGCKNVAFTGAAADFCHSIFDDADRDINGFNDITGYDDFAVMWNFDGIESLPDEVSTCWNEVLILCENMALLRDCQSAMKPY